MAIRTQQDRDELLEEWRAPKNVFDQLIASSELHLISKYEVECFLWDNNHGPMSRDFMERVSDRIRRGQDSTKAFCEEMGISIRYKTRIKNIINDWNSYRNGVDRKKEAVKMSRINYGFTHEDAEIIKQKYETGGMYPAEISKIFPEYNKKDISNFCTWKCSKDKAMEARKRKAEENSLEMRKKEEEERRKLPPRIVESKDEVCQTGGYLTVDSSIPIELALTQEEERQLPFVDEKTFEEAVGNAEIEQIVENEARKTSGLIEEHTETDKAPGDDDFRRKISIEIEKEIERTAIEIRDLQKLIDDVREGINRKVAFMNELGKELDRWRA